MYIDGVFTADRIFVVSPSYVRGQGQRLLVAYVHVLLILGLSTSGTRASAGPRRDTRVICGHDEEAVQNHAAIDAYSPHQSTSSGMRVFMSFCLRRLEGIVADRLFMASTLSMFDKDGG